MPDPFADYMRSLDGDTRRDWSDLDGPAEPPTTGPDPYAYPLVAARRAPEPVAATEDPQAATRSESSPAPVLEPVSAPALYEPCDRCGEKAYAPNRAFSRDGRLLCHQCEPIVWRFGEKPLSAAAVLVLSARKARDLLRRAGR